MNGAFAALLEALGHQVRLLGAAVLLGGPNKVVDHLALEATIEGRPYLVDVGFGDGFARPLPLNAPPDRRLDGRTGTFGFMGSAEGTTLVRYDQTDMPEPQYRFRRVALRLVDFETGVGSALPRSGLQLPPGPGRHPSHRQGPRSGDAHLRSAATDGAGSDDRHRSDAGERRVVPGVGRLVRHRPVDDRPVIRGYGSTATRPDGCQNAPRGKKVT